MYLSPISMIRHLRYALFFMRDSVPTAGGRVSRPMGLLFEGSEIFSCLWPLRSDLWATVEHPGSQTSGYDRSLSVQCWPGYCRLLYGILHAHHHFQLDER